MHISATALNKTPGRYLETAIEEPVVVEKSGRPSVVIVSYKRFKELEDAFWGNLAEQVEKEGEYLTPEESLKFLKKYTSK